MENSQQKIGKIHFKNDQKMDNLEFIVGVDNAILSNLIQKCHQEARKNGWYETERPKWVPAHKIGEEAHELLDQIHLENWIGDSTEHYKRVVEGKTYEEFIAAYKIDGKKGIETELADIVIRAFDFAGANDIDLSYWIALKLLYNRSRGFMHGKKV